MKRTLIDIVACLMLLAGSLSAHAQFERVPVLVNPESSDVVALQDLGFTPVSTFDELILGIDPNLCVLGIAHSGYEKIDWDFLEDAFPGALALIGLNWDLADHFDGNGDVTPAFVPDLVTVAYIYGWKLEVYPLESLVDLEDFVHWGCFYALEYEDWIYHSSSNWDDDFGDDWWNDGEFEDFPFTLEEFERLYEEMLPLAQPLFV